MTTFTEEQIKYLGATIVFLDEKNVKQGFSVEGNVEGNVEGSVRGNVEGSVWGNVWGNVWGDVWGNVKGNVWGDVEGRVIEYVRADLVTPTPAVKVKTPVTAAQAMAQTRENYAETISYLGSPAVDPLNDPRRPISAGGKQMTDNNLDLMTQELIYSDFADLIVSYRLKGTIEDCFAYLEQMGDISLKEHEWQLSDYQDNINMIRGCIQVLQWFTTDNYEHELAKVNKYSLSIGEMF